ncbi:MAG TPA: hypothetical protein DD435_17175 [Cyanobacteria bacterium UBA8530]|nr:hypothetical protein [Cyanobacteria bacterium UBA8530]
MKKTMRLWDLVLMNVTAITYFIPYRVPGGPVSAWAISLLGLFSVVMAIVLPFFPSPDLKSGTDILLYEIEVGGGPLLFAWLGWLLYSRREKRAFEPAMR